jgi:hypothetical protein
MRKSDKITLSNGCGSSRGLSGDGLTPLTPKVSGNDARDRNTLLSDQAVVSPCKFVKDRFEIGPLKFGINEELIDILR